MSKCQNHPRLSPSACMDADVSSARMHAPLPTQRHPTPRHAMLALTFSLSRCRSLSLSVSLSFSLILSRLCLSLSLSFSPVSASLFLSLSPLFLLHDDLGIAVKAGAFCGTGSRDEARGNQRSLPTGQGKEGPRLVVEVSFFLLFVHDLWLRAVKAYFSFTFSLPCPCSCFCLYVHELFNQLPRVLPCLRLMRRPNLSHTTAPQKYLRICAEIYQSGHPNNVSCVCIWKGLKLPRLRYTYMREAPLGSI